MVKNTLRKIGMKRIFALLMLVLSLFGCSHNPTPQQIDNPEVYGPAPEDTKGIVLEFNKILFKDPFSTQVEWTYDQPKRAWWNPNSGLFGYYKSSWSFGWLIECDMNPKNSLGGRLGFKHYLFYIREGKVVYYKEREYSLKK